MISTVASLLQLRDVTGCSSDCFPRSRYQALKKTPLPSAFVHGQSLEAKCPLVWVKVQDFRFRVCAFGFRLRKCCSWRDAGNFMVGAEAPRVGHAQPSPPGWSERFTAGTLNSAPRPALNTRDYIHYVQLSAEETICL